MDPDGAPELDEGSREPLEALYEAGRITRPEVPDGMLSIKPQPREGSASQELQRLRDLERY